ncbi:MAG: HAD family hydrolase [Pseudonocardiaceae bacterium]
MDLIIHIALTDRRAVIFDWDGTLADTRDRNYRSLCAALAPHNITVDPDWYRQHCGLAIRDLLALLQAQGTFPIEQVLAASRAHLLTATTPDTLIPIPVAVTLARQARAVGLPCAVASGAAAVLVNAGLEVLDLREEFQAVVTRDDVEHGKPAPDAFHEAAHRLGIAPEHYLAVEDAPDGLTAARRAGMRVLAVRGGHLTTAASDSTTAVPSPNWPCCSPNTG